MRASCQPSCSTHEHVCVHELDEPPAPVVVVGGGSVPRRSPVHFVFSPPVCMCPSLSHSQFILFIRWLERQREQQPVAAGVTARTGCCKVFFAARVSTNRTPSARDCCASAKNGALWTFVCLSVNHPHMYPVSCLSLSHTHTLAAPAPAVFESERGKKIFLSLPVARAPIPFHGL